MLIEERVTTVEEALVHYMQVQERELSMIRESVAEIHASAAGVRSEVAGIRLEVAEIRASNARTDRQLLEMQQQAEKDREQVEKSRQQAEQALQQAVQQAEKDRAQVEKNRQLAEQDRKDFNKRMAEISDSMGRLIEDMVAPCGLNMAKAIFATEEAETYAIRVRRRHPQRHSEMMELDLLAVGPSKVLVVEAKWRLNPARVADYQQKLGPFFEFFPEHAGKTLCLAVASVYLEPSVIVFLNRKKIYAIAMGNEVMEVINLGQF